MTSLTPAFLHHELISLLAALRTVSKRIPDDSIDPRLQMILDGTVTKVEGLVKLVESSIANAESTRVGE